MRNAGHNLRRSGSMQRCCPCCWSSNSAPKQIGYASDFPDAEHFIIEHDGTPLGRLTTALRLQGDGLDLHIVTIVLSASARGRGVGGHVMSRLDDTARAHGATRLTLSVFRGNIGAQRFYERLGFVAVTDDPDNPNVAMVKPLIEARFVASQRRI